jgi:di/tricarboxylate transporter
VITVWAVFVLSAALSITGVAGVIGRQVLRLAGTNEIQLVAVIMLTAGVLSAFMNNIAVAALLLPVVTDIARRTGRPPSRLLMPLACGALLGGLTTLIGTPPNILASDALVAYGLRPFGLFDYASVGLMVMLAGVAFIALIGRHLLPSRDIAKEFSAPNQTDLGKFYNAVLSPHTRLAGQSLRQIRFREKYELSVLAIQREGKVYHSNLRDMALHFGDALLLHGPREKLSVLASDPDFMILTEEAQKAPKLNKAPIAALLMVAVLLPVILGWLPIVITAVIGATLMVLAGCLTMEEAYHSIEWKAVFLIAGMLPLGIAVQQTGAARLLADGVVSTVGGLGPLAVVAGLFVLTTLATQVMPSAAVAVLLAPTRQWPYCWHPLP